MKARKFNDEERTLISNAALNIWNEVGCDVLQAVGEDNGKGEQATVSKRDVIEIVLDASRLEERLRRTPGVSSEFVNRVAADIYGEKSEIEAFLKKDVFTYSRYGF